MKVYVSIKSNREHLPEIIEMADIMWEKDISLSRSGDGNSLKNCTTLALCWDKWVDDQRWDSHPKFKEYIYFEISQKENISITIEVDDEATIVDIRSVQKAALYLAEECDGKISTDGEIWIAPIDYYEFAKEYLQITFKESVEKSLNIS
jgi:hypothetical protein